ncbi:MAG: cytochrome c oxidase subunit II [Gemmatimonadales bacterium]
MSWIMPPGASTFVPDIDFIYYLILVITGIACVVVEVGLLLFIVKYRGRPGRKALYTHGSTKAEIIWTAVPAVTVVIIGILSAGIWKTVKGRNSVPPDALPYAIAAKQFEWNVTYAGVDGNLNTDDDFTVRNQLHVPVNQPVVIDLTSEDVIHSFFVPAFRLKQDAVPGMNIRVWFEATKVGNYELGCAELCGMGHTTMRATVTVHSADDYRRWLTERAATTALR